MIASKLFKSVVDPLDTVKERFEKAYIFSWGFSLLVTNV